MSIKLKLVKFFSHSSFLTYEHRLVKLTNLINNLRGVGIAALFSTKESGEARLLNIIQNYYPNMIVFDVGANVGSFAKEVVKNSYAELHLFEPLESNCRVLQEHFASHKNVILNEIGMGEKDEEIFLWSNWAGTGASTFFTKGLEVIMKDNAGLFSDNVRISTIDNYIFNNAHLKGIDFLKIDVEGYEMHVLKGALNTIRSKAIKFIQFEFGHFHIYSRNFFLDFWELLSADYEFYRIKMNNVVRIPKYHTDLEVFRATNYICVLKSLNFKL